MGIATLAHVEMKCDRLEESVQHFTEVVGLEETRRDDGKVYLRAYGDWDAYTLVLADADDMGINHAAFKVEEESDLAAYQERIEAAGYDTRWVEAGHEPGQSRALRFDYPGSHPEHDHELELVYDMEKADVPKAALSPLKNQPQGYPTSGVGLQRIDHLHLLVPNVEECRAFAEEVLDFKLRERVVAEDGHETGVWMSVTPKVHELAFKEHTRADLNHIAYYLKYMGDLFRGAEILRNHEVPIYGGPSQHGITQGNFMYHVEPSGNLFEFFNGNYSIFDPQWEPITWHPEELDAGWVWWGGKYDTPQTRAKRLALLGREPDDD